MSAKKVFYDLIIRRYTSMWHGGFTYLFLLLLKTTHFFFIYFIFLLCSNAIFLLLSSTEVSFEVSLFGFSLSYIRYFVYTIGSGEQKCLLIKQIIFGAVELPFWKKKIYIFFLQDVKWSIIVIIILPNFYINKPKHLKVF